MTITGYSPDNKGKPQVHTEMNQCTGKWIVGQAAEGHTGRGTSSPRTWLGPGAGGAVCVGGRAQGASGSESVYPGERS